MQWDLVGREALVWLSGAAAYAGTLPAMALVGLALPWIAALLARSGTALGISVLLTVVALTIPFAGPSGRYQYGTLILLVSSGLASALLAATTHYGARSSLRAVSTELEEARREISELEVKLARERDWRTASEQRVP